jgi:hypothetical protein
MSFGEFQDNMVVSRGDPTSSIKEIINLEAGRPYDDVPNCRMLHLQVGLNVKALLLFPSPVPGTIGRK